MRILPQTMLTIFFLCLSFATAFASDNSVSSPAPNGAVAQAKDGTSLYLLTEQDRVVLHVGKPAADTLAVNLTGSVTITGEDAALFGKGKTDGGGTLLITEQDELVLAWSQEGASFITSCSLNGDTSRALDRANYSDAVQLTTGSPTSSAINPLNGQPVIAGYSDDNDGTIWVGSRNDGKWITETVVAEVAQTTPLVSVSRLGVTHVVWRDSSNAVWHLENRDAIGENSRWLRSGATSYQPEQVGTSTETPSLLAVRHQLLVALTSADSQVEYSLYTGQSWEKNRPCTMDDERWNEDTLSQPKIVADGMGVPWLFFVNNTGKRQYLYYTRWLGFGWDTIRQSRGIFHVTEKFLDCLAPIQAYFVPDSVSSSAREISVMLVNRDIPTPLRPVRIATPTAVARPGNDILFLDMLDVGRSYWTEQVMLPAEKHADAPLLKPSGDLKTLDSTVFSTAAIF